ncbi:ankyrin repeat domain-containing protein [Paraphoma chrysanthemicola]|nr:ankyrin repeat domain-containing protein [Paraphoma chrysanthemicola]
MEAPIPVPRVGGLDVGNTRPRGLVRKSSKLQTHVEADQMFAPSKNWTPIYYAVYHQREAALTHFIRTGGSPDDVDETGLPPICIAVASGNTAIVKILLDAGANNNQTDLIDILLESGPELESGSLATIVSLLKLGAKYDTLNSRAVAIINAAHGKRNKLAKEKEMLLKHVEKTNNRFSIACDPDSTILVEAIKRDDASLVEMFLKKGDRPIFVALDCAGAAGLTVLQAAFEGLLAHDKEGISAIFDLSPSFGHARVAHLFKSCMEVLLKNGADLRLPDLEALIKASDLRKTNTKEQTALHLAAANARAETTIVDSNKHTPLLLAVLNHQWHVAPAIWKDIAAAAVPFCERGSLPEEGLPVIDTLLMQKADNRMSWNCASHEDHSGRDALYYAATQRKPKFTWTPGKSQLNLSHEADKHITKLLAQYEWSRRAGALRRLSADPTSDAAESPFATMFPTKDLKNMISMGLDPNIPLQPPLAPKYLADPNDLPLSLHTLTFLLEEYPTGTKLSIASPFYDGHTPLDGNTILHAAATGGAKGNVKNKKEQTPLGCDKITAMLKDAEEKERRDIERKMRQRRDEEMREKLRHEAKKQAPVKIEKPRQVSSPLPEKPKSKFPGFRTASLLSSRSKPASPPASSIPAMPKLEINIRITTPPSSKQIKPTVTPNTSSSSKFPSSSTVAIPQPTTAASTLPTVGALKPLPTPRIDSGFGQKRPSDTEKPLPVLDRNKVVLDGKNEKRNSSAAELADWLALSKMMDNL